MITGSINLGALTHVEMEVKGEKGNLVKGIFIPLAPNRIEKHEKGGIYLNLVAFRMKEEKDYATHIVKQSLQKDVREAMSKEEQDAMPILGNLKQGSNAPQATDNNAAAGKTFTPKDNLPF